MQTDYFGVTIRPHADLQSSVRKSLGTNFAGTFKIEGQNKRQKLVRGTIW